MLSVMSIIRYLTHSQLFKNITGYHIMMIIVYLIPAMLLQKVELYLEYVDALLEYFGWPVLRPRWPA